MALPSRGRPQLVGSLAARIAEVGRMPLLGTIAYTDQVPEFGLPSSNSAQRVRGLHQALTVPPALAEALAGAAGPVLLVDDRAESGWTLAVAARLLRRAGAKEVFPLVLALQP
ncbi:hypothetical protein GCM10020254_25410 [Streptomyces goshikiensis]